MYQSSYAEVLEDDQQVARRIEAHALGRVAAMLRHADTAPADATERVQALHVACELWMILTRELAAPENALPDAIRANLISVGIWVLKEVDAIRHGRSSNYSGIADICAIVRDGLL